MIRNPSHYYRTRNRRTDFWTAFGAIGTFLAAVIAVFTLWNSWNVQAYDLLRKEDQEYDSKEVRLWRCKVATFLLQNQGKQNVRYSDEFQNYADLLLDHFESLGFMLDKRIAPADFFWSLNSYEVLRYWDTLHDYIDWSRKSDDDQTYYTEFEGLHERMLKLEEMHRKKDKIVFSPQDIKDFLESEQQMKDLY